MIAKKAVKMKRMSKKTNPSVNAPYDLIKIMEIPLPWQKNQWQTLVQAKAQNNLPHALLLQGVNGLGKKLFAHAFIQYLLCEQGGKQTCGSCRSCRLLQAGHHPNVMMITTPPTQRIQIDEIRSITDFLQRSAYLSGYRIVLIHPAQNMNLASSNALLKTLEEPGVKVLLILIADEVSHLPLTILSRCIRINFSSPELTQATSWLAERVPYTRKDIEIALKQTAGAPFSAAQWLQGVLPELRQQFLRHILSLDNHTEKVVIEKCLTIPLEQLLNLWQHVILDLLTIMQVKPASAIINSDFNSELVLFCQKYSLTALWQFNDLLNAAIAEIKSGIPVNIRLVLEKCFIEWRKVVEV